jgi:tRNA modification GTPase
VLEEQGLDELQDRIEAMILAGVGSDASLEIMLSERQQRILNQCQEELEQVRGLMGALPLDCLAVEIAQVLDGLGEVTGSDLRDEVRERIFRDFCIGK